MMISPATPSDSTARLGIVAAYRWEVAPLLRQQRRITRVGRQEYLMKLRGTDAALIVSGAGAENARRAAEHLISSYALRGLLSLGFAGGLKEGIAVGDLIVAEEVIEEIGGEEAGARRYPCQPETFPAPGSQRGILVTVQAVVAQASQKAALRARWGALAADMEAAGVARAAQAAGLPFAALKAITDGPDTSLAIDFQNCQREDGRLSSSKILLAGMRGFAEFRTLWMLAKNSRLAARNLARALGSE